MFSIKFSNNKSSATAPEVFLLDTTFVKQNSMFFAKNDSQYRLTDCFM